MKSLRILLVLNCFCFFPAIANSQEFYHPIPLCNPIALKTCALPMPSDIFAEPDESSRTGMRLNLPEELIRQELLEDVPPSLTVRTVMNGSSGYSAATTVLFELDSEPDVATLPADGGESVIAFNLDTGERVPVRVQISEYARSKRVSEPSQVVEIYPRSRWRFGQRYGFFLVKTLKPLNGSDYAITEGFAKAISNDGSSLANYYEPVIQFFEQQGYSRDELISTTFFTIRDEQEVTGRLIELGESVYNRDHPVRDLKIRYKLFGNIAAYVSGEVLVHNFRDEFGGMVYDPKLAQENWISFRLSLPRAAKKGPVPIAIFSHGIGFVKESGVNTAIDNARMGIATIAIDHPNHGSRIKHDGGYSLFRMRTQSVPMQVGMMVQSSIDHMSLLKAIKTSIGELDILPKRYGTPFSTDQLDNGDGIPDIDVNNIFYQGVSLGGVLGAAFLSIAPDIKGAFLQVPGIGVINILSGSALWDPFFSNMVPKIATGAEALLMKGAMQHEIDYGDAINFVHYLRNPIGMATPKPIAVVVGKGDTVVPNFATLAFAEIAGLPLVGEALFPMPGTQQLADFDAGYGVVQYEIASNDTDNFWHGFKVHFSSGQKDDVRKAWIQRYVLGQ